MDFDNLTELTNHLMLNVETSHLVRDCESHDYHVTIYNIAVCGYHFLLQWMETSTAGGRTAHAIQDMEGGEFMNSFMNILMSNISPLEHLMQCQRSLGM